MILRGHTDVVHDLRFIPESDILLSVSSDKDMRAWRLNDYTCAAIYRYTMCTHFIPVSSANDLATPLCGTVKSSRFYGINKIIYCSGHSYPIWCMDLSVFNLYVATGSHDRTAKLWSLDRIFPLRIFAGHFLDVNVRF